VAEPQAANRAAALIDEWLQARRPYATLPPELAPRDEAAAYGAAAALQPLLARRLGPRVGHKIALTTPQMQKLVGFDRPCLGGIFASTLHRGEARLKAADYVKLAVECEIAVRIGKPPAPPFTPERLADCVDAAMAAIEIVDDRDAPYGKFDALHLIAYNAFNHGAVVAAPIADWRRVDLARLEGAMLIDGTEVGRGKGADVMGHPLNALCFVAERLHAQGDGLKPGEVVLTGSVVTTKWPKPGQQVVARVDGLGEARLSVS